MEEAQLIERGDDGFPKKSSRGSAEDGFVLAAADVRGAEIVASFPQELKDSDVWIWPRGAIEQHLGLASKKLAAQRRFVSDFQREDFRQAIPDLDCVVEGLTFASKVEI